MLLPERRTCKAQSSHLYMGRHSAWNGRGHSSKCETREPECLWQLPGNTLLPYIHLYLYYLIHLSTGLSQGSPWSEAGICSHWGLFAFPKSAGNKRVLLKRAQNSRAFWEPLLGWALCPSSLSSVSLRAFCHSISLQVPLTVSAFCQHPAKQAVHFMKRWVAQTAS